MEFELLGAGAAPDVEGPAGGGRGCGFLANVGSVHVESEGTAVKGDDRVAPLARRQHVVGGGVGDLPAGGVEGDAEAVSLHALDDRVVIRPQDALGKGQVVGRNVKPCPCAAPLFVEIQMDGVAAGVDPMLCGAVVRPVVPPVVNLPAAVEPELITIVSDDVEGVPALLEFKHPYIPHAKVVAKLEEIIRAAGPPILVNRVYAFNEFGYLALEGVGVPTTVT